MAGFWRRAAPASPRIDLVDGPPPTPEPMRPLLRSIVAEAVICQDAAEAVIRGVQAREGLGYLAPRGGPLVRRFFHLRDRLPSSCADPVDEIYRGEIDAILHHHALATSVALELLAYEWRSERLSRQIDALDGLGAVGRRLDAIYVELAVSAAA